MARVTVEDCIKIIPNRFELVALASKRARDISSGAEIKIERHNDKDAVVALREIAEKKISKAYLLEEIISSYQSTSKYKAVETVESTEVKEALNEESEGSIGKKPETEGMFAEDNIEIED